MTTPTHRFRAVLAAGVLAAGAAGGCGKGGDSVTNPDLKVPDVPAGRGQQEKGGAAPKEVKAVKKT